MPLKYYYIGGIFMRQLFLTTSINGMTDFSIAIIEDFGWIEPVFLLISPNLCEVLRLNRKPTYLDKIKHFEIVKLESNYALKFLNSENTLISGNSSELLIRKANHICRQNYENGKIYSVFEYSYHFTELSQHLEYCFFYKADNISYLTDFTAFSVEDYE